MRNQKLICIACVLILCLCIFTACGAEVDADLHITITFMVDGEVYHEMEVKNDSRIKFPDKPTKEGYVFDGWYLTEDYKGVFSTIYLTQNEVTTDLVVYAKWAIETPSGGQHGSTDVDDDAKITGILGGDVEGLIVNLDVSSAIADVDLSGMITVSEGSSWQLYADKTGQTNIPTKIAADLVDGENIFYIVVNSGDNKINRTYTVKIWKNFNVTVRFYAFGYEIHSVSKETHTWITDEDFPDVNYPGYRLVGWAEHKAGEEHYIDDEMLNANERIIKFNAVLEGLKHTISFDGNGVDCDLDDVEVTYGSSFVLPTLTREGYTFDGWEYDGKKIASANGNKYQGYSYAENITVKAIWTINSYNLTVAKNGNYGSVTSSSVNQYNSSVTITATPNAGYLFVGWYGYDGIKVSDDMSYTFNMPAKNVTYIAKWMVCPVALEKNIPEAGEVGGVEKAQVIGDKTIISATTNPGYTWLGWYDGDAKVSDTTTYTFTMPSESKTYTAKWTEYYLTVEKNNDSAGNGVIVGSYNSISFNLNGGTGAVPAIQNSVTATYPTTIPTRSGYVFAGWYDNQECTGSPYDFTEDAIEPITLYAKWLSYSGRGVLILNGSQSISVVSKSGSTKHYYAFVPLTDGEITIYTTGSLDTYGYLYDSSKSQLTTDDSNGDGDNFKITYKVTAGTLYYVYPCGYSSSGTTTIYLQGDLPDDGGACTCSTKMISAGETVELIAFTDPGYTWLGWYDGDTKVSDDTAYTFTMPAENKTYTAKWTEYYVTVEENINYAGIYGIGSRGSISFDVNGGDGTDPDTQRSGVATYPAIPTRYGYVFAGWYDNQSCSGSPYDFTQEVTEDITLYAKWASHSGDDVLNINSSRLITVYSWESSIESYYYAFVPLTDGQITIYTTGSLDTCGYLYDSSKSRLTFDENVADGNNFSITYNVTAGTLYYIVPTGCDKNGGTTIHLEGALPEDGGTITVHNRKISAGDTVELYAATNPGYTWLGWYDGDTKVSDDTAYTFTMPAESKTYTAKWTVSDEMSNFNFVASAEGFTITGIKDKTVTSIVVPNYVIEISEGVFSGCSSLESLTIPFVGAKAGVTSNQTYQYPLGYLFGTTNYTGGTAVTQYYYGSSTTSTTSTAYYIPSSLRSVTVTGGNILYGAFMSCSMLNDITIMDGMTNIGEYAFSGCSGLTSVTIPTGVTIIGPNAFYYCTSLISITIPASVISIKNNVFDGCSSLASITIPASVEYIGQYVFRSCSSLASIIFEDKSAWYVTNYLIDQITKSGGVRRSVTDASANATYFTSTYADYYWYKL